MSDAGPRVSVVVIVRDGERFLAEALESIVAQSWSDWEAIVVDDGSSDRSCEIAVRFVAAHPMRFRLIRHDGGANLGMSASRNVGVAHARGEHVTFLDHDDAMHPTKLARQVEALERHPDAGATVSPNLRWHSWRGDGSADVPQDLGVAMESVLRPPGLLPAFLARTSATPQAPMVRKAVFTGIGGYEPEFRAMYEDQVFLAKLFLSVPVHVGAEMLHRYRQHPDSCVQASHRGGTHLAARGRFLAWLAQRLPGDPAIARPIAAMIRRERWRLWMRVLRSRLRVTR